MRRLFIPLLFILMILSATPGWADEIMTVTVTFDPSELCWETIDGYDLPRLSDCDLMGEVGAPQLPVKCVQVAIPSTQAVSHLEVIATSSHLLPAQRRICPAQPPQILSLTNGKFGNITFIEPKPAIYGGQSPYPAQIVEYTGSGYMGEVHLASLIVYPLQYLPEQMKVRFYDRIEMAIHLTDRTKTALWRENSPAGVDHPLRRSFSHLVTNGRDLERLYPSPARSGEGMAQEDLAEYVIITDLAFQEAFQELAAWKTRKGVPARVVTLQEIDSQYQGADRRERVRNCIAHAYQHWGTDYVLLAGDTQLIPVRYAYAMDSQTEYNDIPCDLYYADLDGDWNADGDQIFGEVEDEVDLLPEVFLGRAPVSTAAQAENFVRKVLTYERPSILDYQQKALFAAEVLWYNPFTDASKSKDMIDERYLPERFDPVTKLYETLGNEDTYSVINALNQGQNIFNHDGHAYYSVMGMGSGYLDNTQVDYLHNGDRIGLVYSIGCWPAAFDYDCIAEHFVNNPQGGAVAFIGNSRYGWGSPGNPCFGYSDRFDQLFFKTVFVDGANRLGEALAVTKAHYAPHSRQENVYRWHQYQLTLLGDPEMPLWIQTPQVLTVNHPDHLPAADSSRVAISVAGSDGRPVEGALICLMDGADVYQRMITGLFGTADISLSSVPAETLWITVTAEDFIPYEGRMLVISSGPHLGLESIEVEERSGNGDGVISPGEQVGFDFKVKNWGAETAAAVTAAISADDPFVTTGDTSVSLGDVAPGETAAAGLTGRFWVAEECPGGQALKFGLHLQDGSGNSWNSEIGVLVVTPLISYRSSWLEDLKGGNGNGIPEAGEELDLHVTLANDGGERARDLTIYLWTEDPYVQVLQCSTFVGDLDPDQTVQATFQAQVAPGCPEPRFPLLEMSGITSDGHEFEQRLLLTVGRVGFSDDLEVNSIYWSPFSTDSQWHFTDRRTHSGCHAWYCGDEATAVYRPGLNCPLTTFPMVVGPGATLSFWHWYDLATYGSDGLYVEVNDGSGWETLDFLGSGGALDSTLIGNDWLPDTYDLSHVPPGTFLQVRFRFYSDEDDSVGEGVYVDDVNIACDIISNSDQEPVPCRPLSFILSQNYPNPFNAFTRLVLSIPVQSPRHWGHLPVRATGKIYSITGQSVKTLLDGELGAGNHLLTWDGRDDSGRPVGSGIYFFRMEAGDIHRTIKMALLR